MVAENYEIKKLKMEMKRWWRQITKDGGEMMLAEKPRVFQINPFSFLKFKVAKEDGGKEMNIFKEI